MCSHKAGKVFIFGGFHGNVGSPVLASSHKELCCSKAIIQNCSCSIFCLEMINTHSFLRPGWCLLPAVMKLPSSHRAMPVPEPHAGAADPIAAPGERCVQIPTGRCDCGAAGCDPESEPSWSTFTSSFRAKVDSTGRGSGGSMLTMDLFLFAVFSCSHFTRELCHHRNL